MRKFLVGLTLFLALLLALCVPAMAADAPTSGSCGTGLSWVLDDSGTLTISGSGKMPDYNLTSKRVPWYALRDKILQVVVEEGCLRIGTNAFNECASLTRVSLPDSLTSIGPTAFYGCVGLEQVVLPAGVKELGSGVFNGCSALSQVVFPEKLTSLPASCFNSTALESVTIPEGITTIGPYAFNYCKKLTKVVLPQSLRKLDKSVFAFCPKLTDVTIPAGVTYIDDGVFMNCVSLTSMVIPEGVEYVNDYLFLGCTKLQEVTLPDSVTMIGTQAFYGCDSLTEIHIPAKVDLMGSAVFGDCNNLTRIELPDGLTVIGSETFMNCTSLERVKLPASLKKIGDSAFQNCCLLRQIQLPEGLDEIGKYSFAGSALNAVVIPDSATRILRNAFQGCWQLKSASIGPNVTYSFFMTFQGCDALTGVRFRGNVPPIADNAFAGCTALETVSLQSGTSVRLSNGAFSGCTALREIALPVGTAQIDGDVFTGCTALETVHYAGTAADWEKVANESTIVTGLLRTESAGHLFHTPVTTVGTPATCTTPGTSDYVVCADCAQVLEEAQQLPAQHRFLYQQVSPTSAEGGYTQCLCFVCGHILKKDETPPSEDTRPVTSYNRNAQDYAVYSSPVHSYLEVTEEGNLLRVEYISDCVVAEVYTPEGKLLSQRRITPELPGFGGFYAYGEHYFLVFFHENKAQRSTAEVFRVVKYSRSWERLDFFSVFGSGIRQPLERGSLRMAANGDYLLVETCAGLYEDTVPNQCQVSLLIRISTMEQLSHYQHGAYSADQYALADGDTLVTAGHKTRRYGGAELSLYTLDGANTLKNSQTVTMISYGNNNNNLITGTSLGGLAVSDTHYLLAGSSVLFRENPDPYYGARNIVVAAVPKDSLTDESVTLHWITEHLNGMPVSTPQLADLGDGRFMILWMQNDWDLCYALLGGDGSRISQVYTASDVALSDCAPVVVGGKVTWYVTTEGAPVFLSIDPDAPEKVNKVDTTVTIDPCAQGHSYSPANLLLVKNPTEYATGLIENTCLRCEKTESIQLPVLSEADYEIREESATCEDKGTRYYTWKQMAFGIGFQTSVTILPKGHTWDEGTVITEPTTQSSGIRLHRCVECGKTRTETIPVLPAHTHKYGLWIIDTESYPNGVDGTKHRVCECGRTEYASYYNPLTDVPNGKYFTKPIFWAYENGITKGKTATKFERDAECTRKQIVTFLWRAAGQPEPKSMVNPFSDVKRGDQFEKAILWAYYEGITSGTGDGTTFSPENVCTRKQIVTFLWRFYGQPAPENTQIKFTDVKNDRFAPAILWAAEQGITTGTGDGSTFSPENTCTRGQIVTFLYRAMAE